jgi:hypothetical protein
LKLYREDLAEWISAMLAISPEIDPAELLVTLQDGTLVCRLAHEVYNILSFLTEVCGSR